MSVLWTGPQETMREDTTDVVKGDFQIPPFPGWYGPMRAGYRSPGPGRLLCFCYLFGK